MQIKVLFTYLFLPAINTVLVTKVYRSSTYNPNSPCAILDNISLPLLDASLNSCIWQCMHNIKCQTAVYLHDQKICSTFGEHCQSGHIQPSGSTRASVICCRKNEESNMYCQSTATSTQAGIQTTQAVHTWTSATSMSTRRYDHTASILSDTTVLVAGGECAGYYLKSAEIYNLSTNTWTTTGDMHVQRSDHTASVLSNGKVLVAGGWHGSSFLDSAELYDPSTGTWTMTGSLNVGRSDHTANVLSDGRVLVTGGRFGDSVELYDPSTGTWTQVDEMNDKRSYHTASILSSGTVLVTGGEDLYVTHNTAELY
ncbi:unnamed protein product [Adineta ricciae]|uniref:Uncharacterized protein n=1 Tax=Adineta ricciae TaxID=249248 RepID=A0A816AK74_ADIRI|nr:unnamed protein product [Adineta ricciae]